MQQSVAVRSDRIDSSDGHATVTADIKLGQLVFLLKDNYGFCSLLGLDRSEDKSTDDYLDLFNRWLTRTSYNTLTVLGAGEFTRDDSDPHCVLYHLDDQPLAIVTTFGRSESMPIYKRSNPATLWWLSIFHHAITEQCPVTPMQTQLAVVHLT